MLLPTEKKSYRATYVTYDRNIWLIQFDDINSRNSRYIYRYVYICVYVYILYIYIYIYIHLCVKFCYSAAAKWHIVKPVLYYMINSGQTIDIYYIVFNH